MDRSHSKGPVTESAWSTRRQNTCAPTGRTSRERAPRRSETSDPKAVFPVSHHHHPPAQSDPTFTAKSRSTWEIVRRVAVYLRPYPWMALGTMGCAVLSTLFGFAFPKLTQIMIDRVIETRQTESLGPVIAGLLGAFLFRDLFNSLRI